jgi:group I intron endonuclease
MGMRYNKSMFIYRLTNTITGLSYVGQTRCAVHKRAINHKAQANSPKAKSQTPMYRAIRKHGWDAFTVETLETLEPGSSQEDLNAAETLWIARAGTLSPAGYNLTSGGGAGHVFSDASKARMSASSRRDQLSGETRRRMSEGSTGKRHTQATRAKMASQRTGEQNGNGKLTWDDVREIRRLAAETNRTPWSIAQEFAITKVTVGHIVRRKTWIE